MPHLVLPPPPPAIVQFSTTENANTKTLTTPSAKSVTAKSISALAPPATFPPEPSSTRVAKSADLLGLDLSVGTPTQQFETSNSSSADSVRFTQPLEETEPSFLTSPPYLPSAVIIKLTDTSQLKSQILAQKLPAGTALGQQRIIELTSKRQVYDQQRQIVTAEGNVVLRTEGTVVNADRLQVNLANLIAVAEGKILLTTGKQVLRGERLTYNFIQDDGQIFNARGEIYTPSAGTDFSLPTDTIANGLPPETPSDRILANQPLQGISSAGGIGVTVGAGRSASNLPLTKQGGQIKRLRFEAERVDFYPQGWQATNVRITNDPFSPPELEVRADKVTLTHVTPFEDRIRTSRQRLVFDQGTSVPIPKNEAVIDRRRREVSPAIAQVGIDGNDRGGVFIERGFTPIDTPQFSLRVAPQFLLQRAVQKSGFFDPSSYGLRANLDGDLGPRTTLRGLLNFTSFDINNFDNTLRASLRLRQVIGNQLPHLLSLEYSFRDRLFNGSLGFQTVQSSLGGIITSSNIPLGKTGIVLNYQGGAQYVNSDTDRLNLLPVVRQNNRVSLGRAQASATLSRGFLLWQGKGLPATATEGLRYTATPVIPYLQAYTVVQGVTGYYTSGDTQESLTGTVGLVGQFGHSSRPFLDYTSFNLSYSQGLRVGQSPFLFDRFADSQVLSAGFLQQLYGPVRLGVQTTFNVGTGQEISTDYILEYSRRTYGVILRYNPLLGLGSLSLRISDFNWVGGSNPFTDSGIRSVVNGVPQENNYFP